MGCFLNSSSWIFCFANCKLVLNCKIDGSQIVKSTNCKSYPLQMSTIPRKLYFISSKLAKHVTSTTARKLEFISKLANHVTSTIARKLEFISKLAKHITSTIARKLEFISTLA